MNTNKILALDIDGVVFDYVSSLLFELKKNNIKLKYSDIKVFKIEEVIGFDIDNILDNSITNTLKPISGISKIIELAKSFGYLIHLVSSRHEDKFYSTISNLHNCDIYYDSLFLEAEDKSKYAKEHKPKIFVEDNIRNAMAIKKESPNTEVFIKEYPWNKYCLDFNNDFHFIKSLSELQTPIMKLVEE